MDGALLAELTREVADGAWGNLHAVLISRHGRLAYEEYFSGPDESITEEWDRIEFDGETLHDIRSISKTVTATLVGIAIREGRLPPVETPIVELLPGHRHLLQGGKAALTLEHVLTMTTGLQWDEDSLPYTDLENDERRLSLSDDPVAFVLARDLVGTPGETFRYSGGSTLLLARILERAVQGPIDRYAATHLFEPLGIERWEWQTTAKMRASPYAGLRLDARGLARIGQLLLDGGETGGRRLLSEEWVREATSRRVGFGDDAVPEFVLESGYGYQMWWNRFRFPTGTHEVATGAGNGEQRIILLPHLAMVVTILAGFYDDPGNDWTPERLLMEAIVPTVREEAEALGLRGS